jgi:hypothetical protein
MTRKDYRRRLNMKKVLMPVNGFMVIGSAVTMFGTETGCMGRRAGGLADTEKGMSVVKSLSVESEEVYYG